MDSWRTIAPNFLPLDLLQLREVCWAISFVRQLEMNLKIHGRLSPHQRLSVQELVNYVPPLVRQADGTIHKCSYALSVLFSEGTVLDQVQPLTWFLHTHGRMPEVPRVTRYKPVQTWSHYLPEYLSRDAWFGSDFFEHILEETVSRAPVTIRISICPSYENTRHGGIYDPIPQELRNADRQGLGHCLLLMGPVHGPNDTPCWECQDSAGGAWGDHGFVLIRRYREIISEFHEMRVSDL